MPAFNPREQSRAPANALGQFAGGIAHDFNNLLVGVVGNADLARAQLPADSPARIALDEITTSAQRAAALCEQLLAYAGKARFVARPVALSAELNAMVGELRHSTGTTGLDLDIGAELCPVEVDVDQLRRLLVNLVTNAAEAIGDSDGTVRVTAHNRDGATVDPDCMTVDQRLPRGPCVCLRVVDDGVGMDDRTRARMFDPFFSTKAAGRGLGLAAVLGIVRRHRGVLTVAPLRRRGTVIEVWLPVAKRPPVRPLAPPRRPGSSAGHSVLVVDDEPLVRDVVSKILVREGFGVMRAEDGEAAVRVFEQRRSEISVIVLDLIMPRLGGKPALRKLRAMDPTVPVVLMSGYPGENTGPEVELGTVGFVQKPFRGRALLDAVFDQLGRHAHAESPRA